MECKRALSIWEQSVENYKLRYSYRSIFIAGTLFGMYYCMLTSYPKMPTWQLFEREIIIIINNLYIVKSCLVHYILFTGYRETSYLSKKAKWFTIYQANHIFFVNYRSYPKNKVTTIVSDNGLCRGAILKLSQI